MKKIISILGSTGSIGTSSLKVINKEKNEFKFNVLSANSNYKEIINQIKKYKPRYFIISNNKTFLKVKNKIRKSKTILLNNYKKIVYTKYKNDITIAAIPGLAGLEPTIELVKKSKKILIANKESIICGWNIINTLAKKNKTIVVPIDSEHFSINKILENYKDSEVEKIYITASGGPFLNTPISKFKKITPRDAIKHPKWKMGKKISVDSATLMNKILELIEAQKIFPYKLNKYEIIIHPQSLVHAIVKFKNGFSKFLYHEPNMIVPITNAIYDSKVLIKKYLNGKDENIKNLEFFKVDKKKFPSINLIPKLNNHVSTPIIINAANEILVDQFLKKNISFNSIYAYLSILLRDKSYKKYAIQRPVNLKKIYLIDYWARYTILKIIRNKNIK